MLFSSKKPRDRLDLILDIQSSIVRGSLMLVRAGAVPHILWTKSIDIPYRAQGGSAYLIKMAARAVTDIAESAHAYVRDTHGRDPLPAKITAVHCVLSSPWIVSRARTISQEFAKDTKITRAKVADIIKAERAQLASGDQNGLSSIEEKIFDVRLNGYSVSEWEGNLAKSLEVSFAISLAGTRMIERFTESAKRASPHAVVCFHSSLLLQHAAIGQALSLNDPYLLIHVHGELTDLVIADGHSCILFGSHPIGVRTIVRKIAHTLNLSYNMADSLLAMHENDKLDTAHDAAGKKAIAGASAAWINECGKLISLTPTRFRPVQAIISARTHEPFFMDSFVGAYSSIKIHKLDVDELDRLVSFDPQAEKLRLTILYAVAIARLETL
jgi:cell division ATPase FtsA